MFRFPLPNPDILYITPHYGDRSFARPYLENIQATNVVKRIAFHSSWLSMSHADTLLPVKVTRLQILTVRNMTEANIKDRRAHLPSLVIKYWFNISETFFEALCEFPET